jgi:hypothetical protein
MKRHSSQRRLTGKGITGGDRGETLNTPPPKRRGRAPDVASATAREEAVTIYFECRKGCWDPFFEFQTRLHNAIMRNSALGYYDGNLISLERADGVMYLYGPDANALYRFVWPFLLSAGFLSNVVVALRYGGPSKRRTDDRDNMPP